ncbi:MAG TPA: hypothetical protein PK087_03475 [Bacilli bacterium]|mgnify:CR=1 FL=1|nr:MAG: hypothetical protein BWY97_01238 [Tenericutes bacterium ADurb.BinA124]HNZ50728.1 hypothetical protein [Bacilli bacterium]HOH18367.1 hypothetical protein [Bacilli bacterium]HPN60910.1 hypothetical protein [Bacilli bacterium]HPX84844.1 hypothetical protein [Bacilli bacterium]
MNEERMKILEMLAEGLISAAEANELLSTLDKTKVEINGKEVKEVQVLKKSSSKFLYVKALSSEGDRVNLKLPLALVKATLKSGNGENFLGKMKINGMDNEFVKDAIDYELIMQYIENDMDGNIVDVESAAGDSVNIYIE